MLHKYLYILISQSYIFFIFSRKKSVEEGYERIKL